MISSLSDDLVIGAASAGIAAYTLTPVAIHAARRFAFYDVPAGYKGHRRPTPYLGGAAVMAAFALAAVIDAGHTAKTVPLLLGVGVLWVVGTIDDRRQVSPLLRVVVELLLGGLLGAAGLGWRLDVGVAVDAVATAVWVVAIVNAFNLFDNMDGAASTMAIAATAGTSILALVTHNAWAAAGSAALCGACLGFLPHNLAKPARIFLGDGGSMPLGFAVAILTASAARTAEPSGLALLTGLLLVGIPALDTCLVIVSRRRRGISILTGGQDHLTHRTRRRMRTARRVALVLGSAQVLVSALVIVATQSGPPAVVWVLLGFLICAATAIVGLEGSLEAASTRPPVTAGASTAPTTDTAAVHETGGDGARSAAGAPPWARAPMPTWPSRGATLGLVVLGLGAGLSPLFSAYFDAGIWVPIGLVVILAGSMSAIVRPPGTGLPVVLSLAALAGLGLWSLLSTGWAQAGEQAIVDGNRWLAYMALLLLLIVLVRRRVHASVLLAAVGTGILVVGISVLVRMLGADPISLFIGGRLNSPLGYINGEGCVFAMGCWLSLALAERREPALAGLGAGVTVMFASLTLLTQSRGAAIATFVAIIVALVVVPGVRRRVLALATIGAGLALAAGPAAGVYTAAQSGVGFASAAHSAVIAIVAGSALAAAVWAAITAGARAAERRGERSAFLLGRAATVLTVLVLLVPVLAAAIRAPALERAARNQWHAFVHLSASSGSGEVQTRLFSGAGNRYDYWRVAWQVFTGHPVIGVGAGNFTAAYYAQRHTQEAIQNPHSIELQSLSELGIVGAGLLVLLICAGVIGAPRLRAAARRSRAERTTMVAATGIAVVWLVDTSGDWMHLLPGVTAIALAALAVLCRAPRAGEVPPTGPGQTGSGDAETGSGGADHGPRRSAGLPLQTLGLAACAAFALVVGGASLLRSGLAQHYLSSAQSELSGAPAAAIADANSSLRLDGANLDAYYVKAAGQARFGRAAAAQATLLAAARTDASDYVTWTLLGDLEVRRGNLQAARAYYSRAHALDPNDPGLARLAADPASAQTAAAGG